MKVGVYGYTQNWWDNERFVAYEADPSNDELSNRFADNELFQEDLRFLGLVEDLGFDDIWTVEHHFSPYAQTTNPLQYLSYMAGRTTSVGMGTLVIVLPWHDPVRLAEEIINLQYFLGDRDLTIGVGRGVARREYGGLRIPQGESAEIFAEVLEVVRLAIGQERFSFEGKHFTIPDVAQRPMSPHLSLRPTPLDPDRLLNSFHGAWGSPGSITRLAPHGLKPLIIPQRAVFEYEKELFDFYDAGSEAGYEPDPPIVAQWIYCSNDPDVTARGEKAYRAQTECMDTNYELTSDYFKDIPGYEHYVPMGPDGKPLEYGIDELMGELYDDVIIGSPEKCLEMIQHFQDLLHPKQINLGFKFGDLTFAEAESSMRLFAKEVLPEVKKMEVLPPKVRQAA